MRRGRYLTVSVLLVLIVVGAVFVWRREHRGPSAPSISDAIGRFRTSSTTGGAATEPLLPRGGVYLYDGTGRELLSFMSTEQSQGPTEPGTVVRQPHGCWQFRIDFNSFHSQTWIRCAGTNQLTESGGTTAQKFDFGAFKMAERSTVTCAPFVVADLGAEDGTTWPVRCEGRSKTTKATFVQQGVVTFVGREPVTVDGATVPAVHTRERLRLSGGQTGTVSIDIWFAADSGLPLNETHSIRVVSPAPSPLGQVTYTEDGTWHLESTTPRT